MWFKFALFVCSQALLIQSLSAEYIGAAPIAASPCAGSWGAPYGAAEWDYAPAATLSASNGPGVAVATASPFVPAGVSVLSENAYEGTLAVDGTLPFLGTVGLEGIVPSAGSGVVAYNCGSGFVGITSEDNVPIGINGPLGYGAGIAGPNGYGGSLLGSPLAGAAGAGALLGGAAGASGWGAPNAIAEAILPAGSLAASTGPGLAVSSTSPLSPTGVLVLSENAYEGPLAVNGAVPFLGTVSLEGALPTAGTGAIAYGCGNGAVGITAENIGAAGLDAAAGAYGGLNRPFNYGYDLAAPFGRGCGAIF